MGTSQSVSGSAPIGLIPAGGRASRVAPLPCSKEILPIGFAPYGSKNELRLRVSAHDLLDAMKTANVSNAYFVLRKGKWDIPSYFGNGSEIDLPIGYLLVDLPCGVPFTLDAAFPFIQDKQIVFGFPDILFRPKHAFIELLHHLRSTEADIVLGLFPAVNTPKMDMIEFDAAGKIKAIHIKPESTTLTYAWINAVWNHSFSTFIHNFVSSYMSQQKRTNFGSEASQPREIHIGEVVHAAVQAGLCVDHVFFDDGSYIDIGTPEDMITAIRTRTGNLCISAIDDENQ